MSESKLRADIAMNFAPWWAVLLNGIVGIILGILLVINPVTTVIEIVYVLGWYWLITGILGAVLAVMEKENRLW